MSRDELIDVLWSAFEQADNCYCDPKMDVIDTGGTWESFDMGQIADYLMPRITTLDPI